MIYPDFYPFYATQGSPGFYNEEREQEKEFDLMRSYYPDTVSYTHLTLPTICSV